MSYKQYALSKYSPRWMPHSFSLFLCKKLTRGQLMKRLSRSLEAIHPIGFPPKGHASASQETHAAAPYVCILSGSAAWSAQLDRDTTRLVPLESCVINSSKMVRFGSSHPHRDRTSGELVLDGAYRVASLDYWECTSGGL